MEQNTRICKECGEELPIECFRTHTKSRITKRGIVEYTHACTRCKECEDDRRRMLAVKYKRKKGEEPQVIYERPERTTYEGTGIYTPDFLRGSATCAICKRRVALADFPRGTNFQVYTKRICNECHENDK